jgi:hypothetical protein
MIKFKLIAVKLNLFVILLSALIVTMDINSLAQSNIPNININAEVDASLTREIYTDFKRVPKTLSNYLFSKSLTTSKVALIANVDGSIGWWGEKYKCVSFGDPVRVNTLAGTLMCEWNAFGWFKTSNRNLWRLLPNNSNGLKIVSNSNFNLCLDYKGVRPGYGSKTMTYHCWASDVSSWGVRVINNSWVSLVNLDDTRFCLDVSGGDRVTLQLWGCNDTNHQQFRTVINPLGT